MNQLIEYLENKGFEVEFVGGVCPFQIEANHKSGLSIYFRSRGDCTSLDIYNEHLKFNTGLPHDKHLIYEDVYIWGNATFEAGYIESNEANYYLALMLLDARDKVELPF